MSIHAIVLALVLAACGARPDLSYNTRVASPALVDVHPRVVIDEAHNNDKLAGKFAPFARLLTSDGYDVRAGRRRFSASTLAGTAVLVIANARGKPTKATPAFTDVECDAVEAWVRGGGSLLLVADHAPFGEAAMLTAQVVDDMRFGMNSPGVDNRQLVLDIMHWLSGVLP